MAQNEYYPEEVLVGKMQSGEYGWLDYVNHFSADWHAFPRGSISFLKKV